MKYVYYHNPKCSKSRAGLEALESRNIIFEIKEYFKDSFTVKELERDDWPMNH